MREREREREIERGRVTFPGFIPVLNRPFAARRTFSRPKEALSNGSEGRGRRVHKHLLPVATWRGVGIRNALRRPKRIAFLRSNWQSRTLSICIYIYIYIFASLHLLKYLWFIIREKWTAWIDESLIRSHEIMYKWINSKFSPYPFH